MVAEPQLVTAREFALLPEQSTPIQLIGGEIIVSPSPNVDHEMIVSELKDYLRAVADERHLGRWFRAPLDLFVTPYDVFQPDLMLFGDDNLPQRRETLPIDRLPAIVVEVLSPSNRRFDLVDKLVRYASRGVPEYWIVDPERKSIVVDLLDDGGNYQQHPVRFGEVPVGVFAGASLPLDDIFES